MLTATEYDAFNQKVVRAKLSLTNRIKKCLFVYHHRIIMSVNLLYFEVNTLPIMTGGISLE